MDIPTLRRRRDVVKASVTRLAARVTELQSKVDEPSTVIHVQKLAARLESLNAEFKVHHYGVIDAIPDDEHVDENLAKEQDELDKHDSDVANLSIRLEELTKECSSKAESTAHKIATLSLTNMRDRLNVLSNDLTKLSGAPEETHLVEQYQEQVSDLKKELSAIRQNVMSSCTPRESDALINTTIVDIDKLFFDVGLSLKKLIVKAPAVLDKTTTDPSPESKTIKLPRLDIPTFDGNILHWLTFWEQYRVAIHDRSDLSQAQKLVYLGQSLKDGSARNAIEGLSRSGEQYGEAVKCLQERYDHPRTIHQAHVRKIVEVPSLKDNTGKELRRLHDVLQQHLRALKAMDKEPSAHFITSLIEMKLDFDTMFEWQKASQDSTDVPHYLKLLEFLNLRAQVAESTSTCTEQRRSTKGENPSNKRHPFSRSTSLVANVSGMNTTSNCVVCKSEKHPLYACTRFKAMSHDKMIAIIKENNLCINCLKSGHFSRQCPSLSKCRKCQKPHHTLIHVDPKSSEQEELSHVSTVRSVGPPIPTHGATPNTLLMTCQVLIHSPNGTSIKVRALLDSASSTSFISEHLTQTLRLPRSSQNIKITGIAGLSHHSPLHSVVSFEISPTSSPSDKTQVTVVAIPRVTSELPPKPVHPNANWSHISDLNLADPHFGRPGSIDILLGIDIYANVLLHGRRNGPPGSPVAFETKFGWVLAGGNNSSSLCYCSISSHHVSVTPSDELLRKFWEIEEQPHSDSNFSPEEQMVVKHFKENHRCCSTGRFVVPLPRKPQARSIGECRAQLVRRFLSLERSLHSRNQIQEFSDVIEEYFEMQHAELVPVADLQKSPKEVFYLPMHAVRKERSTTTKVRAVFDASAKSTTGVSLNDTLLVGPTVHPPLVDVLLRFRYHRIALTADVSKMYCAIELIPSDRDLHRFVWRKNRDEPLKDYRMSRVTFGVSASSFAANMSVKQNALDHAVEYPQAAEVVNKSFYVDDCLTGADSIPDAIELQRQLLDLFKRGGFLLRKWNSSEPKALQHLTPDLKDPHSTQFLSESPDHEYTKTLGIEWNASSDHFRLTIAALPPLDSITKRMLVSDIAKTFDVLGWFSPSTIKVKILLQRLWEKRIDWDDPVPSPIYNAWLQWRSELNLLSEKHIPRCYFDKRSHITSVQLHGFCDASENAYAAVVYLRLVDSHGAVQISLATAKTKVAPIKRLTIPRLELCGAYLLAQLLHHVRRVLEIPLSNLYAWTDSTIVLHWLDGNPRRFKTYVGNRISTIMELIPPEKWNHVSGLENPADCASRGLFPSELLHHSLWWSGPEWLRQSPADWPQQSTLPPCRLHEEERETALLVVAMQTVPIIPFDRFSNFNHLKRVTAWIFRFIDNCRADTQSRVFSPLSAQEMLKAEYYWIGVIQSSHFEDEALALSKQQSLKKSSPLLTLHPFMDSMDLIRVGGRQRLSQSSYESRHPMIVPGKHPLTKAIIHTEHIRLLHAGPTLLSASLSRRYHIIGGRSIVRSIVRECVVCRRNSAKPRPQMLGQLPFERITPGPIFDKVGVDYAGPVLIKYGHVRRPTVVKAYICVFVSLTIKAVHLELVTDLTSDAFIASLRRFIARRGKPSLIWSDHGTNFVGAAREIKEFYNFLKDQKTQESIISFLSRCNITCKFIPPHAPHFGGLWEAAVKSTKTHLRRIVSNIKLTYEEFSTVLAQVEACLNSRPLVPLPSDEDGIEALTPGHFLIGRPLEALPDSSFKYAGSLSSLCRWQLCQVLTHHFWKRWSREYITHINRFTKWRHPSRNIREY